MTTLAAPLRVRDRRAAVATMLRDGAEVAEIADILASTVAVVRRDAIVSAGLAGASLAAVARRVGVSRAYASRVARDHGIRAQERSTARIAARRARVAASASKTAARIARATHVSARTIRADRRVLRAAASSQTRAK